MLTMGVTETRKKLTSIHSGLKETVTITNRGKPILALMNYEMYESIFETLAILSDPELAKELHKSIQQVKDGELIPLEELEKEWA